MRWASTIATAPRLDEAIADTGRALRDQLGGHRPDLALAFASVDHLERSRELPDRLCDELEGAVVVGCLAAGVIGGGREVEYDTGLAVVAASMPGVEVVPFHLEEDERSWERALAVPADADPSLILLPDPFSCDTQGLIRWLDDRYPTGTKIGGLASAAGGPGGNVLVCGRNLYRAGAVGVALTGNLEVATAVAQGCRPIGVPMFVTRCAGNVLIELDGLPAVKVLEALYAELPPADQQLFRHSLFLGLVMKHDLQVYERGDFLIRNLVGVDARQSAIAVAARLRENQVVQFHLRDAATSAEDLGHVLGRAAGTSPAGALLFSCTGRGRGLYDCADHDSHAFQRLVGDVPVGGFFCAGEIGPVQGQTYLHGYTSCFGLFRPRRS